MAHKNSRCELALFITSHIECGDVSCLGIPVNKEERNEWKDKGIIRAQ